MGIMEVVSRRCTQTAVYWGNPQNTGSGGRTFDTPVEISCRWEDRKQVLGETDGTPIISRAVVIVLQDVDEEGLLLLSTLATLTDDQKTDPMKNIEDISIIKRFSKIPVLGSTTSFMRKAFLTPWLS